MTTMIQINQFYHRAKEKDLVRNEKARLSLVFQHSGDVGARIHLLLDYQMTNADPSSAKRHAYAASILFDNLSKQEYDGIIDRAVRSHGRNDKGQEQAMKNLLARDDIVFVTKDEGLLKHPLIEHKFGELSGRLYGGGDVGNANWEAISKITKEVSGPNAYEDQLYEPIHPKWEELEKNKSSDLSY